MSDRKILLAGFSGAGKTTFLRELEKSNPNSDWAFDDLDQVIMKNQKVKTLAFLIEDEGWEKFRLYERQALESWLKDDGSGVLALGGGTLSPLLLELYKPSKRIKFCYLHAPFELCWERLNLSDEIRPLVKLGKAELHRIYEERQKVFSQISWRIENEKESNLASLAHEFWSAFS